MPAGDGVPWWEALRNASRTQPMPAFAEFTLDEFTMIDAYDGEELVQATARHTGFMKGLQVQVIRCDRTRTVTFRQRAEMPPFVWWRVRQMGLQLEEKDREIAKLKAQLAEAQGHSPSDSLAPALAPRGAYQ